MAYWSFIALAILIAASLALSRHIDYNSAKRRHVDTTEEDEGSGRSPTFPRRWHSGPPQVLHTKEGGSEILECMAGGSPPPRIYWLKNGEQLSKIDIEDELELKDDEEQRLNMGVTSSRLYLDCLSVGDEAEYTCIAKYSYLRKNTTTRVTNSSDDGSCHDEKLFAPRIVTWTETAVEYQGKDVRVFCRAEGDPKPSIKWLDPLEEEIDPERNSRFETLPNDDLVIRNLEWNDMGHYICVAGSARVEIFVYPAALET